MREAQQFLAVIAESCSWEEASRCWFLSTSGFAMRQIRLGRRRKNSHKESDEWVAGSQLASWMHRNDRWWGSMGCRGHTRIYCTLTEEALLRLDSCSHAGTLLRVIQSCGLKKVGSRHEMSWFLKVGNSFIYFKICTPKSCKPDKNTSGADISISTRWNGESTEPRVIFLRVGRCGKTEGSGLWT